MDAHAKVAFSPGAGHLTSQPSQLGRGGWTWYTGSASWMYRVGLENILGFTKVGDTLRIAPCVPRSWPGYAITYRFGRSTYEITVRNPAGVQDGGALLTVDGARHSEQMVRLVDDGQRHVVVVDAVPAGTE